MRVIGAPRIVLVSRGSVSGGAELIEDRKVDVCQVSCALL
jgi:hypothetical protein